MTFDRTFALTWWERLLEDERAMRKWLQKLQITEIDGYYGNLEAINFWNPSGNKTSILLSTANDERKHSCYLVDLLATRGWGKAPATNDNKSYYWEQMENNVNSFSDWCAMTHLGEQLAADRFEVIGAHKKTPADIKWFIDQALPDEAYHARSFRILASDESVEKMTLIHNRVIEEMKTGKK